MFLAHYYIGLPFSFAYSLIISFFLLKYFQDSKKTNTLLFIIGVIHLSSLFLMPIMCCTLVLLPVDEPFIEYNDLVYRRIIKIITYSNHVLNKLIYPMIEIYCSSGYISFFKKLFCCSIKQLLVDLFNFWYSIALMIIYLLFKNFYDNTFDFLLNYLNILDLVNIYLEIGYSLGSITLLYKKTFKAIEEYENFLLGKLSIYKKENIEKFKEPYKKVFQNCQPYIKDNVKYKDFGEIKNFIEEINNKNYFEIEKFESKESQEMTPKKLENLISKQYEECKEEN